MKIVGTVGNIKQGTNLLISCTFADWSAMRGGTFVRFDNDLDFYTVSHVEQKTFLKDFVVLEPAIIQINENCGVNVNEEDTLNLSFKEYEINTIYKIINAGLGYRIGDLLNLNGGLPSINIVDNTLNIAIIKVNRVGINGEVQEISIENRGKYIVCPPNIVSLEGSNGKGSSIEVSFKLSDHRTFIERDAQRVEFKSAETIIYLTYALPNSIKEGKLSIEKWEAMLTSNYTGTSKVKQNFQIIRDFTPNYRIPLLAQNAQNQELIYNRAITLLDRKIAELENKIKILENNRD